MCPLLAADIADPTVIAGIVTIGYNLTGCNGTAQISTCNACALVSNSALEYNPEQLNIYPNPTQNILHFQYDSSRNELINFSIKNQLGQQLTQSQSYPKQSVQVDISSYPAGVYVLNILQGDKSMSRLFRVSR